MYLIVWFAKVIIPFRKNHKIIALAAEGFRCDLMDFLTSLLPVVSSR